MWEVEGERVKKMKGREKENRDGEYLDMASAVPQPRPFSFGLVWKGQT